MSTKNYDNLTKKSSLGSILYRALCILLVFTALTAWSVSGVFAKYVTGNGFNGNANVAKLGIDKFELVEHDVLAWESVSDDDLQAMVKNNNLHILDMETETSGTKEIKLPYGKVNVPKDPFIRLKLDSALNYELYLVVNVDTTDLDAVSYQLTDVWTQDATYTGEGQLYKYSETLTAGTVYDFTGDKVIKILKDDVITINSTGDGVTVSLSFEAYIRQVL